MKKGAEGKEMSLDEIKGLFSEEVSAVAGGHPVRQFSWISSSCCDEVPPSWMRSSCCDEVPLDSNRLILLWRNML